MVDLSALVYLFDGVVLGLTLSMVAVGLTLIYGLVGVLNLSHGEMTVLATVSASILLTAYGMPIFIALPTAVAFSLLFSVFMERIFLKPVYSMEGEERILLGLYMTLALAIVVQSLILVIAPTAYLSLSLPSPTLSVAGFTVRTAQILAGTVSAAVLFLLHLFLRRTWAGRAIRSLTQNELGAKLVGIRVERYRLLVFILGGLLAAIAGFLRGVTASVAPESGIEITILALLICVMGGIRSVYGTMVSGVLLGVIYTYLVAAVGTYISYIILLLTIMLIIAVRPFGILGERE